MDLGYTKQDEAFREEVKAFLKEKLPAGIAHKVKFGKRLTKQDLETWHAQLNERGWLAPNWPVEWGGAGWSAVQNHIFDEEAWAAGAPRVVPFGVNMLAPVLIRFGSDEQKNHYLPRILDGTDWWCQGYSEPGAGSDLASLKTRAVRRVITTSSMARKPGQRWATLPTGFFAWCGLRPRANRRKGYPFC